MKPTRALLAAVKGPGRTPSIHFLGPRHLENLGSHTPHAHVAGPPEYQGDGFQAFLKKLNASWGLEGASSSGSSAAASSSQETTKVFTNFWEVPNFKALKMPDLDDADMEVVMSGGASTLRR
ncbi:hypothetical protein FRB94_006323 [Tulasnella sp. JGI-2019a]|nr:hypothetical protein FRB94_006323 [Tulasnella sp. JGI-2019a]KAG9017395.1 hypothetical protein FRB93_007509 [Tulasnella sp. JGI-2019a]KAG9038577.1 hypothetical protein FRB95_000799 [Tulasnella sp. JGI-2019a]